MNGYDVLEPDVVEYKDLFAPEVDLDILDADIYRDDVLQSPVVVEWKN